MVAVRPHMELAESGRTIIKGMGPARCPVDPGAGTYLGWCYTPRGRCYRRDVVHLGERCMECDRWLRWLPTHLVPHQPAMTESHVYTKVAVE